MLEILKDLVEHTTPIGSIDFLKLSKKDKKAVVESVDGGKNLIMFAETKEDVDDFTDVFGIGDINKLAYLLKNPEYQKDAKIEIVTEQRDGDLTPSKIIFQNAIGDFKNTYRFMGKKLVNVKLENIVFTEPKWDAIFSPSTISINRLKLMAGAHPEEIHFKFRTKDGNLMLTFGVEGAHAGEFVFHAGVEKKISDEAHWPISLVMPILNMVGEKEILISNDGLLQLNVDSGLVKYKFLIPAQSK